jgi:hypothetical protein
MRLSAFFFILVLCACQGGGGNNSPEPDGPPDEPDEPVFYPFNPDFETLGGIEVELRGHSPEPLEEIDLWYQESQQCLADWFAVLYPDKTFEFFDPPPVIIEDDLETLCATEAGFNAVYCGNYADPIMGITGVTYQFENFWKHEFLHHGLFLNEISNSINLGHKPDEIWSNCVN